MTLIALFVLDKRKTHYTVIPKQETFLASSRRCSSAVRATQLGCAISLHLRVRELGKTCGFESPPRREGFLDWDWAVRSWPPLFSPPFFLSIFGLLEEVDKGLHCEIYCKQCKGRVNNGVAM